VSRTGPPPTVVLIHGAFHGPWCWEPVARSLRSRGVEVEVVDLPCTGFEADVAAARAAIAAAGQDAFVGCHSYGGVVADAAMVGITGVSRIVYVAAVINAGLDAFGPETPAILEATVPDGTGVRFDAARAGDIFYGDSDDDAVARAVLQLRPMVLDFSAFVAEPPPRPLARSVYVICTRDGALPTAGQRRLAALCDEQVDWPTDHSPFLTRPAELARLLTGENRTSAGRGTALTP
jgi:pimeloyl-ACP methyl ester carboxylesterase